MLFLCECSDLRCEALLKLSLREYEKARRLANRFLVAIGHETPEIEVIVSENKRFALVEKQGVGKEVAEASDRRSRPG